MMFIRNLWRCLKKYIASPIKAWIRYPYKIWLIKKYRRRIPILKKQLKERNVIRVAFFVMNLAMWKSDRIVDLMLKDTRFQPIIVLIPRLSHSTQEKRLELKRMQEYFSNRNIEYINTYDIEEDKEIDERDRIKPDIVFYQQPYDRLIWKDYEYTNFPNALICYIPYDFKTTAFRWGYDNIIQNIAWKLFYPTTFHKRDAEKLSVVKGINVSVVGYPMADEFLSGERKIIDVWKYPAEKSKRLIWAPHYTVDNYGALNYSTFSCYHEIMFEIAEKYGDKLQIAFKPHPYLLPALYKHPLWGKEKTDAYYRRWEKLSNGMLVLGDYIDLFLTSDAMIHDCGSFSVEYHYTRKPVMFLAKSDHLKYEASFGRLAFDMHYKGYSRNDIENFIERVVLGGDDSMLIERQEFFNKYLLPPNGKSVAQNICDSILK